MKKFLFLILIVFAFSYSADAQINYTNPEKVLFEAEGNNQLFYLIGQEETSIYEKYYFFSLLKQSLSSYSSDIVRFANIEDHNMSVVVNSNQATTFTLNFLRTKVAQVRSQIATVKSSYATDQEAQQYFKSLIVK